MDERPPMERAMSTDVVVDVIMSYLKERDLLSCRKVSKCWNNSASSVLRRRSTMIKNISDEIQLMKFEECMKESLDFPFAGLKFCQPWRLKSAEAMEFFRNFGAKFTRLRLNTSWAIKLENLAPFINLLPRLAILEIGGPQSAPPDVEFLESAAAQEDDKVLKISSVRTIRILCDSEVNTDILRQLCTAASPSLRIECLQTTPKLLEVLESTGKLQAVSVLNYEMNYELDDMDEINDAWRVDELLSIASPMLTKLDVRVYEFISNNGLINLLVSSQHSLKELNLVGIHPSQFLSESPVFTKLTTLGLSHFQSYEIIFQGIRGYKFPALKELKLDTGFYFSISKFSDGSFIVPSLIRIDLNSYVTQEGMEDLAGCFPNVIEIRLKHDRFDLESSRYSPPTNIWSVGAFKLLKKLVIWDYVVQSPTKKNRYMDSFLTGIPINICENLRQQAQQNLTDSPLNEISRDSPSILHLKNLKELIICVKPDRGSEELPEEPPFISMVSVWYALDMMPDLKARFVYEHGSPSWRFQEKKREKAVTKLKGVFKNVQPYVALEPFFYGLNQHF